MDLYNRSCVFVMLAIHLSVLRGKIVYGGHYVQTVQLCSFIPALLIDSIYICHFIPLSAMMTWAGGHKVNKKQNLLAPFFGTLLN